LVSHGQRLQLEKQQELDQQREAGAEKRRQQDQALEERKEARQHAMVKHSMDCIGQSGVAGGGAGETLRASGGGAAAAAADDDLFLVHSASDVARFISRIGSAYTELASVAQTYGINAARLKQMNDADWQSLLSKPVVPFVLLNLAGRIDEAIKAGRITAD
jgi:hypothetical protein